MNLAISIDNECTYSTLKSIIIQVNDCTLDKVDIDR